MVFTNRLTYEYLKQKDIPEGPLYGPGIPIEVNPIEDMCYTR